jgi:hypothetical protein
LELVSSAGSLQPVTSSCYGSLLKITRRANQLAWHAVAAVWATWVQRFNAPRERAKAQGFRVIDSVEEAAPDDIVAKVVEALDLLATVDARRLNRLRQDLDAIALLEWAISPRIAAYMPRSRTCYLSMQAVRAYSVGALAVMITHEGTHARLDKLHAVFWWGLLKYRMEHRCLQEELDIAKRLPNSRFPDTKAWVAERAAIGRFAARPPRRPR